MGSKKKSIVLLFTVVLAVAWFAACVKPKAGSAETRIDWQTGVPAALDASRLSGRPVLMAFTAEWCPWCKRMEDSTYSDKRVVEKMSAFVPLKIDVDMQKAVADRYGCNAQKNGGVGIPNVLFLSSDGKKLKHVIGYRGALAFAATLDSVSALNRE